MSTALSVSAVVGCVHPSQLGNDCKGPPCSSAPVSYGDPFSFCVNVDSFGAVPAPLLCFMDLAPIALSDAGGPFGFALSNGIGTCIATDGDSPIATLSTGKLCISLRIDSETSRITKSTDVLFCRCHCNMASRKSARLPGTTAGGTGAWYIVTPMRCARPSSGRSHPPFLSPLLLVAAVRITLARRERGRGRVGDAPNAGTDEENPCPRVPCFSKRGASFPESDA
mmetsp:Transcript_12677/g.47412  ORF Transcript_12677/g.47412 Transcript_12677/m.47412 type:complete len:225 (-) Transcript_12677:133-807(-)